MLCRKVIAGGSSVSRDMMDISERLFAALRSALRSEKEKLSVYARANGSSERTRFRVMVDETLKQYGYKLPLDVYVSLLEQAAEFPAHDRAYLAELFSMLRDNGMVISERLLQ